MLVVVGTGRNRLPEKTACAPKTESSCCPTKKLDYPVRRCYHDDVFRVGVIRPGGAGRGNTLAFATRRDAEIVAAADTYQASLAVLEDALQQGVVRKADSPCMM
ncbi:hypothetical protein C6495_04930 [Candidatus Poribacteria bacterium]|nr:MAG: hypothetical protein C6495_04930 [Candidatus Poribacteria bacterium]